MRRVLAPVVLSALLVASLGFAVACGDDEDERLSDEAYFAKLTDLDEEFDGKEGDYVDEDSGAKQFLDFFRTEGKNYRDELDALNPPEDVQDEHDALIAVYDAFLAAAEGVELDEDAPAGEFFDGDLSDEFAAVEAPLCALQEIADQKGIDAFVGCSPGGPPPPPEVDIINTSFQPSRIELRVGDVVTWTQRDNVTHTVTEDDGLFDSGTLPDEGLTFEFTFTDSGEYSYHCEIHSSMTGVVTVVK